MRQDQRAELVERYAEVKAAADRLVDRGVDLPGAVAIGLPNALGFMRRVPGTAYHRPGPNGREDPPTDQQIARACVELIIWAAQLERRALREGYDPATGARLVNDRLEPAVCCWSCGSENTKVRDTETRRCLDCGVEYAVAPEPQYRGVADTHTGPSAA